MRSPRTREATKLRHAPRRRVILEASPRALVSCALAVVGVVLLFQLWPIVVLLAVALVLVGTLNPLVVRLEARGLGRRAAVLTLFLVILAVGTVLGIITLPPLVEQLAELAAHSSHHQRALATWLERHAMLAPLAGTVRAARWEPLMSSVGAYALAASRDAVVIIGWGATALVLALYIIADRERARGALYAAFPRTMHVRMARILANLETIVGGYIRGQVITSACMGVFAFALLSAVGVDNALSLAVFAALTDVLPFVGGLLATAPAVAGALSEGPLAAVIVLVVMVAYQELESRVIVPRVYGRVLRLPAAVVIVALLAGGILGGIVGALLALPVAAGLRMMIRELRLELPGESWEHRPGEGPQAEQDAQDELDYARRTADAPAGDAARIAAELAERAREE